MVVKYICSLLTVMDIQKSKEFYLDILNQEVDLDHGENISFNGGFAIHDRKHFQQLISEENKILGPKNCVELYFESDDLDNIQNKLENMNATFLHKIHQQPWGQRVMRFYDPDDYIIEVGEPMDVVIIRYFKKGMNSEEISKRTSMPQEIVEIVLKSNS
ncbi:MAG: VOC family protein [Methanobacteriaceae archaeon]|nr:VOC family protein [Methanobacteriaceae archaeon]MDO9626503.1 VOC family protein [Methanobacteriaceae archaeon]